MYTEVTEVSVLQKSMEEYLQEYYSITQESLYLSFFLPPFHLDDF